MESLCKTDVPLAQEGLHPEHATLCVHVYARVCTYVHMHPCVWCVILYVCVCMCTVGHVCDRQGTGVLLQTDRQWDQLGAVYRKHKALVSHNITHCQRGEGGGGWQP